MSDLHKDPGQIFFSTTICRTTSSPEQESYFDRLQQQNEQHARKIGITLPFDTPEYVLQSLIEAIAGGRALKVWHYVKAVRALEKRHGGVRHHQHFGLNSMTKRGDIPLVYSVKCGHYDIVEYLIEKGADVDHADPVTGVAPLHQVGVLSGPCGSGHGGDALFFNVIKELKSFDLGPPAGPGHDGI